MVSSIYSFSNQAVMATMLRNKGEKTIPMFFMLSDLRKFKKLIKEEENPIKQKKMVSLKKWYIISLYLTFSTFILLAFFAFFAPLG